MPRRTQAASAGTIESRTIRALALATLAAVGACSDAPAPTGPAPRATARYASVPVKSIVGLEPLIDATENFSTALDISDLGVVVGWSSAPANGSVAVVWDGSTIPQNLGSLGGQSSAAAIAPNGSVIVGNSSDGFTQYAVRWIRVNGDWVIDALPQPAGATLCFATDVASTGSAVGACLFVSGQFRGVLWRNGIATDLGDVSPVAINANNQILVSLPTGSPEIWDLRTNPITVTQLGKVNNVLTLGSAMNDAGEVALTVGAAVDDRHPYIWTRKKGFVALPMLSPSMVTTGINNVGNVVGGTSTADALATRAVYWSKNKSYELGVLPSYQGAFARAISASSQVVGSSFTTDESRATLWTLR